MKVLLVKTSSMGDILHTLPAVTEATQNIANIEFHWVVEEAFKEIPNWHPAVTHVYTTFLRAWKKDITNTSYFKKIRTLKKEISKTKYDLVIDAQGLLKSVWISNFSSSKSVGYSWKSIKEPLASIFYSEKVIVPRKLHAVDRIRKLFSSALRYKYGKHAPSYDLSNDLFKYAFDTVTSEKNIQFNFTRPFLIFVHATSREDKKWPILNWQNLCNEVLKRGYCVLLPWGNEKEKEEACKIAKNYKECDVYVLPKLTLTEVASVINKALGVVTVDTGLGHMAAALSKPTAAIYSTSCPSLVGTYGANQIHLKSTSHSSSTEITPKCIWDQALSKIIK